MGGTLVASQGDVLLNSTGTGTIGRSAVFSAEGIFIVDGHVTVLRPMTWRAMPSWLNSVLSSDWFQRHLETHCYSGSTNQVELSATALARTELPVPPLSQQRSIAEVLDTLDEAIRGTEAVVAKLKAMKQGLLHDLLTRGIDANGDLRPPVTEAAHLYHQTPLGWLPKEWEAKQVGVQAVMITSGSRGWAQYYSAEGSLFIRSQNVRMGNLDLREKQYVKVVSSTEGDRTSVEPLDFLVTITGNGVGNSCFVPEDWTEPAYVSQHVGLVRFVPRGLGRFAGRYFVEGGPGQVQIKDAQYGQSKPGLSLTNLAELQMPIPPESERIEILKFMDDADEKLAAELQMLAKLGIQKSGLMDDLLTGRVSVSPLL